MTATTAAPAWDVGESRAIGRSSRLGVGGLMFVLVTVLTAVGAVNSQNNLLFWVFGLAIASVVVSGIVSGAGLMRLDLHASTIPDGPVGEPVPVAYTARSRNRLLPVFGVTLEEQVEGDNRPTPALLLHIAPKGTVSVETTWIPDSRGPFRFETFSVRSDFPFGFISKTVAFSSLRTAIATPPVLELRSTLLEESRSGSLERKNRVVRRDANGTYFGVREYAPGDPRRTIAWKPTARRGSLQVVEHAEPQGEGVWAHVGKPIDDDESVMIERAFSIAVSLVRLGTRQRRPVGVWIPWAGVRLFPAFGSQAEALAARAIGMVDLADELGADSSPPLRQGETTIRISVEAPRDSEGGGLSAARPAGWLASGASLPPWLCASEDSEGSAP